jgi:hypothetical protein
LVAAESLSVGEGISQRFCHALLHCTFFAGGVTK